MLLPDKPVLTFDSIKKSNIQTQNEEVIKNVSPVALAVRPISLAAGVTSDMTIPKQAIIPEGVIVYTKEEYKTAKEKISFIDISKLG